MKRLVSLLLIFLFCHGAFYAAHGAITRREVPVRFEWPASYSPLELDSGWQPDDFPCLTQNRGFLRANAVPYAFEACGNLVFSFDAAEVWPGNTFSCSVWLEPYDSEDLTEIRSDFGCEFGVEARDWWTEHKLLSYTKDFMLAIEGNGGLPLGDEMIGGWDTLEFLSIPIDEIIPGSDDAVDLVQGMLEDVLDANGISTGVGTADLIGELVVRGNYLSMRVGDTDIELKNCGSAAATNAMIHVPSDLGETLLDTFEIEILPYYNFTIYKGIGVKLTAFGPLSINMSSSTSDRLRDMLPDDYEPPSQAELDENYKKAVDGATVTGDGACWVSFPINERPLLPDMAIYDIVVNPQEPSAHGKAYANEEATIAFTLSNIGGAPTLATDELVVKLFVDGVFDQQQVLNNKGNPPSLVLGTNDSVHLEFHRHFTEGMHEIELRSGHAMLKGYAGGQPVYGLGDPFFGNHMKRRRVYTAPQRGTVIGRVFSNPSWPGEGINGVPVRLAGLYRSLECVSAYDVETDCDGIYRFGGVPPGNYRIEILPPAPTNSVGPRYWPRSFSFTHSGDGITDLRDGSGLFMRQYQRLHGTVSADGNKLPDAVVRFGEAELMETVTDEHGDFIFTNVPPSGRFTLTVDHPDFLVKKVRVDLSVSLTATTDTYLSAYYDLATSNWVSGAIALEEDAEPPELTLEPFDNDGRRTTPLTFAFYGSDQNGRYTPDEYRWQVFSTGGAQLLQCNWTEWPTNAPPNRRAEATADLSSLADGSYRFAVQARDRAGNVGTTPQQPLTLDKTAPQINVAVDGGAAITASRTVPVTVNISNSEPGTLKLELSNNGTTWSDPWFFSGTSFTVSGWELNGRETFGDPVTVRARVTDAVGLQTVATDSINLATVGTVVLANGWEAWTNTVVPLEIGITPPNGVLQKQLGLYGSLLDVGGSVSNRYRAQAFVLPASITFNRIRLNFSSVEGDPAPLTVRVVTALDNADPTGAASAVWSWITTAEQLRETTSFYTIGGIPAQSGFGTVLPAGTNYVIFSCDSITTADRYVFVDSNPLYNGDGGLRYDHNGSEWIAAEEEIPGMGSSAFSFGLWNSPNGQIRICTDGTPDTEPWVDFPFPDDPYRTVTAPGEGPLTVIVDYTNTVNHSRDGTHSDSIVIDTTPPVVTAVTLQQDTAARGVLMDLNVSDAQTRVAAMKWRFDDAPWSVDAYRRKPFLYCPPSFKDMTWVFVDAAGNETAPIIRTFSVDMSAPTLTATANDGKTATRDVILSWLFHAQDDQRVEKICVREARTATNYPPIIPEDHTFEVELPLPQVIVNSEEKMSKYNWVDGYYSFEATAYDRAGNASETVFIPITLDRVPPRLMQASLTGTGGESPVTGTNLLLQVSADDNIGPLQLRWRWKSGTWSDWSLMPAGQAGMRLDGYLPMPPRYEVDLEIRDTAEWTVKTSCGVDVNHPPDTPRCIHPDGPTGDPPFLFGSAFSDPDDDRWGASQFAVRDREEIVFNTGELDGADRYVFPTNHLAREIKYLWSCRYLDEHGAWSDWSEWLRFDCRQDSDGDGIPDEDEETCHTDPYLADSDGDNIPDGLEDLNANGILDDGETDPRLADTDGDGLDDDEEDLNMDARLNSNETSPALADTDGDRANDRHERLAETDPRNPESSFRITSFQRQLTDGRWRVSWQAHGGKTYCVMADDALGDSTPPAVVTNLTAVGGLAPWYVVPMSWTEPVTNIPKRVYFIQLIDE